MADPVAIENIINLEQQIEQSSTEVTLETTMTSSSTTTTTSTATVVEKKKKKSTKKSKKSKQDSTAKQVRCMIRSTMVILLPIS